MSEFIKCLELCESFFMDIALPIIKRCFPDLRFSAGLIGYGSDVLGYDDKTSTDHMWGPRFYLFLSNEDIHIKEDLTEAFSSNFPYEYKGYSVNFTKPNPNDNSVKEKINDTALRNYPLIGSLSQIGNFVELSDNPIFKDNIKSLYGN